MVSVVIRLIHVHLVTNTKHRYLIANNAECAHPVKFNVILDVNRCYPKEISQSNVSFRFGGGRTPSILLINHCCIVLSSHRSSSTTMRILFRDRSRASLWHTFAFTNYRETMAIDNVENSYRLLHHQTLLIISQHISQFINTVRSSGKFVISWFIIRKYMKTLCEYKMCECVKIIINKCACVSIYT